MKIHERSDLTAEGPSTADLAELAELELSDEDILHAMRRIPGYLDISTMDFRDIYHLAHARALGRLFGAVRAGRMMRTGIEPLTPEMPLDAAARSLAGQGLKGLPVVDADGGVVGMLTEADFLRRLKADTVLGLLLRLIEDPASFSHRCQETPVRVAMTSPAVTVRETAGLVDIVGAFRRHAGRGMPVVDETGRLKGLLLRKDFIATFRLEGLF
jgi:CBS-domain-containing membrane protein